MSMTTPTPDLKDIVERARYRVNNPSAWEHYDEGASELFRGLTDALLHLQSENERLRAPKRDAMLERSEEEWDALEDATMTVYGLKEGHTLTPDDMAALHLVDACHRNDEESATDSYHRGHEDGLRQLGGDKLVEANRRADEAWVKHGTERALRKFAEQDLAAARTMLDRYDAPTTDDSDGGLLSIANRIEALVYQKAVAAEATLTTLRARVEEVVRPFAEAVEYLDEGLAPDLRVEDDVSIERALFEYQQPKVGHLRALASLLQQEDVGNG